MFRLANNTRMSPDDNRASNGRQGAIAAAIPEMKRTTLPAVYAYLEPWECAPKRQRNGKWDKYKQCQGTEIEQSSKANQIKRSKWMNEKRTDLLDGPGEYAVGDNKQKEKMKRTPSECFGNENGEDVTAIRRPRWHTNTQLFLMVFSL